MQGLLYSPWDSQFRKIKSAGCLFRVCFKVVAKFVSMLFQSSQSFFRSLVIAAFNLKYENMIGVGSDGAAVVSGVRKFCLDQTERKK